MEPAVVVLGASVVVVVPTPTGASPLERRNTGIITAATSAAPAANMSTGLARDFEVVCLAMSVSSGNSGGSGDIATKRRIMSLNRFSSFMTGAPQVACGHGPDVA